MNEPSTRQRLEQLVAEAKGPTVSVEALRTILGLPAVVHELEWSEPGQGVRTARCSCGGWERGPDGCMVCVQRAFNEHAGISNHNLHH